MLKIILPVALIVILFVGALYLIRSRGQVKPQAQQTAATTVSNQDSSSGAVEVPASLPSALDTSSPLPQNADTTALTTKVISLEDRIKEQDNLITDLTSRVSKLESSSPVAVTSQSSSSSKSPAYIYALGSGGSVTAMDWQEVPTLTLTIDPASYPGYTNMQLETLLRVKDGNGTAFARLYSSSDGQSIAASQTQTGSYADTWVASSQTFNVSSKKTYTFQLKSLTGYDAIITNARVKINF